MTIAVPRGIVLALVVACLQLVSPPAHSGPAERCQSRGLTSVAPLAGAVFNDPAGTTEERYRITSEVRNNIASTPVDGVIRIATHGLSIAAVTKALVRAADCGVKVRVVVPGTDWETRAVATLRDELGTDLSAHSWIAACDGACASPGSGGIMHAKLHLFSKVVHADGVVQDVTTYSSSNLVHSQANPRYNDAYQVVGDPEVYESATAWFDNLTNEEDTPFPARTGSPGYRHYWFPAAEDFHRELFERTTCRADEGRTRIELTASIWKRTDVADQLVALQAAGCRIKVLLAVDKIDKAVLQTLYRHEIPTNVQSKSDGDLAVHSKFIAIRGTHRGSFVETVYTGSLNVSRYSARTANNVMLRVFDDETAYLAYHRHFKKLWELSRPLTRADVRSATRVDAVQAEQTS